MSPTSELNSPLIPFETSFGHEATTKFTTKPKQPMNYTSNPWETIETTVVYDNGSKETVPETTIPSIEIVPNDESCSEKCWDCIESVFLRLFCSRKSLKTGTIYQNTAKVFFNVDRVASRAFPLTFLIINVVYWVTYIYIL